MKKILSILLISLLLGVVVMGSGIYNIAATEKHWMITEKIIEWVRDSSIATQSKDIEIPSLSDPDLLITGAKHYHAMCTQCHLAPGIKPTELAHGLYPQAPVFYQRLAVSDEKVLSSQIKENFWVIKNGLKMTAMPAWGLTHDDKTIWGMAIFVQQMSGMTVEQYNQITSHLSDDPSHEQDSNHSHP